MPYDDPKLKEFDGYFEAKKPGVRERAENWAISIGLQKVDGLVPSDYLLSAHPDLTQAGMVAALGISRQAIQKHLTNLKKAGRLRRVGPDKGGHWEVVAP